MHGLVAHPNDVRMSTTQMLDAQAGEHQPHMLNDVEVENDEHALA